MLMYYQDWNKKKRSFRSKKKVQYIALIEKTAKLSWAFAFLSNYANISACYIRMSYTQMQILVHVTHVHGVNQWLRGSKTFLRNEIHNMIDLLKKSQKFVS